MREISARLELGEPVSSNVVADSAQSEQRAPNVAAGGSPSSTIAARPLVIVSGGRPSPDREVPHPAPRSHRCASRARDLCHDRPRRYRSVPLGTSVLGAGDPLPAHAGRQGVPMLDLRDASMHRPDRRPRRWMVGSDDLLRRARASRHLGELRARAGEPGDEDVFVRVGLGNLEGDSTPVGDRVCAGPVSRRMLGVGSPEGLRVVVSA